MRKRVVRCAVAAGCVLLAWTALHARAVRSIWLERDVRECEIVAVGMVTGVQAKGTKQRTVPGMTVNGKPYAEEVEILSVSYRVEIAIKGQVEEGKTYQFRHYRLVGRPRSMVGTHFFSYNQGETYLLFLKQRGDGAFEPVAPEWEPVTFGPETLKKLKALPRREDLVEWVIDMLVVRREAQRPGAAPAIRMLEGSPSFKKRAGDRAFRDQVVRALVLVTEKGRDGWGVGSAYTLLGELNETSVIPKIVEFACSKGKMWEHKSNAINWLQGFPAREQVKALEEIAAKAHDPRAVGYARSRLGRVRWRVEKEERRERLRKGSRPAPPRTLDEALARRVTFEIIDTPLGELAGFLKRITKVDVVLKAGHEAHVTLDANKLPVAEALRRLAEQAGLETGIAGGKVVMARPGSLGEARRRFEALLPPSQQVEQALKKKLRNGVTFEVRGRPVGEAVRKLKQLTRIDLSVAGGSESLVTLRATDMPLGEALWWVAHLSGLDIGLARGRVVFGKPGSLGEAAARFKALLPSAREAKKELNKLQPTLARKVGLNFTDTPLDEAVMLFQSLTGLNIVVHPRELKEKGGPRVTVPLRDVPVRDAIEQVARAAGLRAGLLHGAVYVAAKDELTRLGALPLVGPSSMGK